MTIKLIKRCDVCGKEIPFVEKDRDRVLTINPSIFCDRAIKMPTKHLLSKEGWSYKDLCVRCNDDFKAFQKGERESRKLYGLERGKSKCQKQNK